jgi:hypothetical protein
VRRSVVGQAHADCACWRPQAIGACHPWPHCCAGWSGQVLAVTSTGMRSLLKVNLVVCFEILGEIQIYIRRQPDRFHATEGYNPQLITMLTRNYRTLPEILEVASHLFYDNQLVGFCYRFWEKAFLASMQNGLEEIFTGKPYFVGKKASE